MSVKKYNISKPEKYNKDGVEKTYWANVGTMTEFKKEDGSISRIIEIPAIGLKANIFPFQEKDGVRTENPRKKEEESETVTEKDPNEEEINSDDIPF